MPSPRLHETDTGQKKQLTAARELIMADKVYRTGLVSQRPFNFCYLKIQKQYFFSRRIEHLGEVEASRRTPLNQVHRQNEGSERRQADRTGNRNQRSGLASSMIYVSI